MIGSESLSSGAALGVPLHGYAMVLRPSELAAVAAGLAKLRPTAPRDPITLVEALRQLLETDRAPVWELAVRRFGGRKTISQAAGEIGMDVVHAEALLEAYIQRVADTDARLFVRATSQTS
ncbi:MAG: hypothetical protein ACR2IK_24555 [Chloroflexota bacterium]